MLRSEKTKEKADDRNKMIWKRLELISADIAVIS